MAQTTSSTRTGKTATLDSQGRLVIPAEIREKLGFESGERLTLIVENNSLRIMTRREAWREVQQLVSNYAKGRSLVDELIAERRAEAARE